MASVSTNPSKMKAPADMSRLRSQSVGPNNRQNKIVEEKRPISQTNSKQKLGVAFGSRASKNAQTVTTSIPKKSSAVVEHPPTARKNAGEQLMRGDSSPPKGFARLQQMAGGGKPLVMRYEDEMSQGVQGYGLAQSSRASELRGESEYLKFSGEQLSEDQLDKLIRQNREVRRR